MHTTDPRPVQINEGTELFVLTIVDYEGDDLNISVHVDKPAAEAFLVLWTQRNDWFELPSPVETPEQALAALTANDFRMRLDTALFAPS